MGSFMAPERRISHDAILPILQAALSTRSTLGWSQWLQGEIQSVLPHYALIAAWGDFESRKLTYDVITRSQDLSMDALPPEVVEPLMQTLFALWLAGGQEPIAVETLNLRTVGSDLFSYSPCVLVHGVQDRRSRCDTIYVFVGPAALAGALPRDLCRMALPYIDTAFRQLEDRGQKDGDAALAKTGFSFSTFAECPQVASALQPDAKPRSRTEERFHGDPVWGEGRAGERGSALSRREVEVMTWVRMGKTNSEIAAILGLSTFTVKNHMRRIYKKMDVLNRAQAVGCLDRMQPAQPHAAI